MNIYILSEQHVATTMMCKKVKEKKHQQRRQRGSSTDHKVIQINIMIIANSQGREREKDESC